MRTTSPLALAALAAALACGDPPHGPRQPPGPPPDTVPCAEVAISPAAPMDIDEAVLCTWVPADPEDASLTASWQVGAAPAGSGPVLANDAFAAGDIVTCTVGRADGSCASASASASIAPAPIGQNILLILCDDVGVDAFGLYGIGPSPAHTPTIDALAASGVLFSNLTANAVCSPSRAALQTGRYAWRTGVTDALTKTTPWALQFDEVTLPELLAPAGYDASYLGKWHLGTDDFELSDHPNLSGWPYYAGMLIGLDIASDGLPQGYFSWEETVNGVPRRVDEYMTTVNTDRAIARVAAMPEPWLTMVGYYAAHQPEHWPPDDLVTGDIVGETTLIQQFNQVIEAMDTEIGRLLASLPTDVAARTTVIFLSDNGTFEAEISPSLPTDRGKETPYEGGSHVPLLIAGPWVARPGTTSEALVNITDLYATIADLGGVAIPDPADRDAISLVPALRDPDRSSDRTFSYAEQYLPVGTGPWREGWHTIRDARWKLIEYTDGTQELYDMQGVEFEGADLLAGALTPEQQVAHDTLEAAFPVAFP
jgi:arylsulfatase A-like enzyme